MTISIGGTGSALALAPAPVFKATPQDSTASFAEKLASVLQGFLSQNGASDKLQLEIQTVTSQETGARQFVVTVTEGAKAATAPTPTAPATQTTPTYTLMGIPRPTVVAPQQTAAPDPLPPGTRLASGKLVTNEYEAYWATQPAEVQQLMKVHSEEERMTLAKDLADRGYLIDVPIMVWNWDPLTTMMVRKNQGFTWVPSAKMDPVQVAPGLTFPGKLSYDPDKPPPGAIMVSTDFAKGLEHTCPWLKYQEGGVT